MTSKRRQKQLYSWTGALMVAGIVAVVNIIFSYLPLRLDTSEGRVYSLSKGSKDLLKKLEDPLTMKLIFSSKLPPPYNLNETYVRDLLAEYKRASGGKIRVEYVDPGRSPEAKNQAMQEGVMPVQLDVRERDRRELKECFMGVSMRYQDKRESLPFIQDTQSLEYEISQRIKKLISPERLNIGIVTNGGAQKLTANETLKGVEPFVTQLYGVHEVDLSAPIPPGIKTLWLLGPTEELDAAQLTGLRQWVQGGGTLGLLIDRYDVKLEEFRAAPKKIGLEDLLKEWGVDFKQGLIYDRQSDRIQLRVSQGYLQFINVVDYPYFPMIIDLNREHPATKNIDACSFPFASPLIIEKEAPGLIYTPLAKTSKYSWLNTTPFAISPQQPSTKPGGAQDGPFNVGLLIEGNFDTANPDNKNRGRVLVFGCSRFIRSDYPLRDSNVALFINLIDWSVQDEALLSIRSKGAVRRPLREMKEGVKFLVKFVMICALPLAALLVGLFVWLKQRRRRALLRQIYA